VRWPGSGRDEGVERMLVHHGVDAFISRQAPILLQGVVISLFSQWTFRFRFDECVLSKVQQFFSLFRSLNR